MYSYLLEITHCIFPSPSPPSALSPVLLYIWSSEACVRPDWKGECCELSYRAVPRCGIPVSHGLLFVRPSRYVIVVLDSRLPFLSSHISPSRVPHSNYRSLSTFPATIIILRYLLSRIRPTASRLSFSVVFLNYYKNPCN